MAVEFIIAKGIGFSPGSTKYLPTHGFLTGAAVAVVSYAPVVEDQVYFPYTVQDAIDFRYTQEETVDYWEA